MTDFYLLSRAGITADYITASQARELYDAARDRPASGLEGDFESGFGFWFLSADERMRLVHYTVIPLCDHEVATLPGSPQAKAPAPRRPASP